MQYNLVHRGTVLKSFDTNAMDPEEVRELKRLDGRYFRVERAIPDTLPPMPDGYSMLAQIAEERSRVGKGYSWRRARSDATQ